MSDYKRAVLAGGCFWGMQDLIRKQPGVVSTRVGYTGGQNDHPTYRNHPGHAEAVEIVYDPAQTDYRALLEFFFQIHDPTTKNRQGNDHGPQYASVVFAHDESQRKTAEKVKAKVQRAIDAGEITDYAGAKVRTAVEDATVFFPAHEDHQRYLEKRPGGYCNHRQRFSWEGVKLGRM